MILTLRGRDNWGSGDYMATRGARAHNGIDVCCNPYEPVLTLMDGLVTRIGYPYDPSDHQKGHFRYVEVSDNGGFLSRYFYVQPDVEVGKLLKAGDSLGKSQELTCYHGITQHYHYECFVWMNRHKVYFNPMQYLKAYGYGFDRDKG